MPAGNAGLCRAAYMPCPKEKRQTHPHKARLSLTKDDFRVGRASAVAWASTLISLTHHTSPFRRAALRQGDSNSSRARPSRGHLKHVQPLRDALSYSTVSLQRWAPPCLPSRSGVTITTGSEYSGQGENGFILSGAATQQAMPYFGHLEIRNGSILRLSTRSEARNLITINTFCPVC